MPSAQLAYLWLAGAIGSEVVATAMLQKSQQFTRLGPSLPMMALYAASLYFLSHALKALPLGVAYAIWDGLGILLTAVVGFVIYGQRLDLPTLPGIGLMVAGVVVMNVFSRAVEH